jgi:predicted ATPase/transcriptional regulator with XRE-family HTH domain
MEMGQARRFGERLRRYRAAPGYSQEELAERAGLTANAISALERGERKRPYPDTVRRLAAALGLSKDERLELVAAVARARGRAACSAASDASALPRVKVALPGELTPLIGREREAKVVLDLLSRPDVRLLALTGAGGVGKTRLALYVAGEVRSAYPDGVVWVPLAPLADPGLVLPTIARSLGLREAPGQDLREALHSALGARRVLLVLDNFEHVLEAARDVAALPLSCPGLDVLATSRAPLGVRGEQESPVPPLELPSPTRAQAPRDVQAVASVRLFVRRAQEASPSFELTRENAAAVAAICRRLDGLPLALELAAARVKLLSPAELLARLGRALPLLTGGPRDLPARQQTMRNTLGWSYDLLSEPERSVFRRLAVFRGGWDLETVEVVGAGGDVQAEDVLDLLGRLAEQSLVMVEGNPAGMTRYRLLEPVRQYAAELLEGSGEADEVMRRHARHYLALVEQAEPELRGRHQVEWLDRLELESDNVRAAVEWSLEGGDVGDAIRIARGLTMYWVMRGGHREGRAWMERALDRGGNQPAKVRAEALYVLSICEYGLGNDVRLMEVSEGSAALYRQVEDRHGEALASGMGGFAALRMGDLDRAEAILDQAAGVTRELDDKWITALFLDHLAVVPLRRGDYARAARHVEEALELSRQTGDRLAAYTSLHILAQAAQGWGDHELAARYFGEALQITHALGDRAAAAYCLQGLAQVAEARGDAWHVARLLGAAEALLETVVPPRWAFLPDCALHERTGCVAREQLGEAAFESAWSEGRAMRFQRAVEYGLSANEPPEPR